MASTPVSALRKLIPYRGLILAGLILSVVGIIALIILLISLLYYYRKKHLKPITGKELDIDKEFNVMLDTLRNDIANKRLKEAKEHYQDLLKIYLKVRKSRVPLSKKQLCYQKIREVHSDIMNIIGGGRK